MASGVRAEILETGDPLVRSVRIRIEAPPERVFALLADPRRHEALDGSGTVRGRVRGPERLALGSRFGMAMRIGLPYRVTNTVVEFEEGRRIAWCHFARNRWRYELAPDGDGTVVTESFDCRTGRGAALLERTNTFARNETAMARTLVRLKALAEAGTDR